MDYAVELGSGCRFGRFGRWVECDPYLCDIRGGIGRLEGKTY